MRIAASTTFLFMIWHNLFWFSTFVWWSRPFVLNFCDSGLFLRLHCCFSNVVSYFFWYAVLLDDEHFFLTPVNVESRIAFLRLSACVLVCRFTIAGVHCADFVDMTGFWYLSLFLFRKVVHKHGCTNIAHTAKRTDACCAHCFVALPHLRSSTGESVVRSMN